MDDRTLLELAAKAAGMRLTENGVRDLGDWEFLGAGSVNWGLYRNNANGTQRKWNPLTNDGDEARLEAALCMHVQWHPLQQCVTVGTASVDATEPWGTDRQAARRRAGVRAAAELGRQTNG